MTTPSPRLEQQLVAVLDAIDEPVSIASAIRDRDGCILDFRIHLGAIKLGDGYLSTWRRQSSSPGPG